MNQPVVEIVEGENQINLPNNDENIEPVAAQPNLRNWPVYCFHKGLQPGQEGDPCMEPFNATGDDGERLARIHLLDDPHNFRPSQIVIPRDYACARECGGRHYVVGPPNALTNGYPLFDCAACSDEAAIRAQQQAAQAARLQALNESYHAILRRFGQQNRPNNE